MVVRSPEQPCLSINPGKLAIWPTQPLMILSNAINQTQRLGLHFEYKILPAVAKQLVGIHVGVVGN